MLIANEKGAGETAEKPGGNGRPGPASLRSENDPLPSAVEMPPRGKRGKLKKPKFFTLSTGLGNPAKNQSAGFPHFHRADGGGRSLRKDKK
jgi:hypothetical protein